MTSSQMQVNYSRYLINMNEVAVYRIALQIELCIQKKKATYLLCLVALLLLDFDLWNVCILTIYACSIKRKI